MQLAAILLARSLWFVESFDLNPRGEAYYPDIVAQVVEKCGFIKFPQKAEDFDEEKGVEFIGGKWGNVTIEMLKIYRNGLLVDTRASTAESDRILDEALNWAASKLGVEYHPKMIARRAYLSNLTFYTDTPILGRADSPVSKLTQRVGDAVREITGDKAPWQPVGFTLHSDPVPRKPVFAAFAIQRRAEAAFSENKYYSEAPLPTAIHLEELKKFEEDVEASEA